MRKGKLSYLLAILFLLGACSRDGEDAADESIELVIWITYKGPELDKFHEISKRFCKEYAEKTGRKVKILGRQVPYDDLDTYVRIACMAGRNPDIARVDALKVLEMAYHEALVPLDTLPNFDAKSIEEKAAQYMKAPFETNVVEIRNEKHLYGLPEQTTCLALFWNRELFEKRAEELKKAGLNPYRAPETWEELIEYGKVLTYQEGDEKYYGFAMNNSLWWTLPYFGCFGTRFIADDFGQKKCILGDERSCAALQLKVDLYHRHKIEAGAWKSGAVDPELGFMNKKYAMVLLGPWLVEKFRDRNLRFEVALIPRITERQAQGLLKPEEIPFSATNVGGNNLVIFKTCRHKEIAYDFIAYLTSYEVQKEWCLDLKQIPVHRKAFETLEREEEYLFDLDIKYQTDLDHGEIPPDLHEKLKQIKGEKGALSQEAFIEQKLNTAWLIRDKGKQYLIMQAEDALKVHEKYSVDPIIKKFLNQSEYAILPPPLPRYKFIESDVVNRAMALVLEGESTAEEALKTAATTIEEKLLSELNQ